MRKDGVPHSIVLLLGEEPVEKIDFKKTFKHLYQPSAKEVDHNG